MVCVEMIDARRRDFFVALVFPLFGFLGRGENGRHEVGEALADAGARLDDQVMLPLDGVGHGIGHGQLFAAVFVVWQPRGDAALGPQDFSGRDHPLA